MENTETSEMMENRRYAYICEGVTDEDKLKKLGCLFVVPTGGKFIRPEIRAFIRELSRYRRLVLVLDPDGPGKAIRDRVTRISASEPINIYADKKEAIQNGKVGIAQMSMESLGGLLFSAIRHDMYVDENLSFEEEDFDDLGLTSGEGSKTRRMVLVEKYHLPYTSGKKVMEYLWMLGINRQTLEEDLENE